MSIDEMSSCIKEMCLTSLVLVRIATCICVRVRVRVAFKQGGFC